MMPFSAIRGSRDHFGLLHLTFLQPSAELMSVECNSIQINLGLWWPLILIISPPLRLFASWLYFGDVGSLVVHI